MNLLTDRSLDIPLWLRRNEDGSFAFPDAPIPQIVTEAVTTPADPIYPRFTAHDLEVIAMLRANEGAVTEEKRAEQRDRAAERREQKKREQVAQRERKMKQRKVFMQHFKWDFEQP